MKKSLFIIPVYCLLFLFVSSCIEHQGSGKTIKTRTMVDTAGFAHLDRQMDSVLNRIERDYGIFLNNLKDSLEIKSQTSWKVAISPHDDYAYASYVYPAVLDNVKTKTVILFGVAHKARLFDLEDVLVFDSFDNWQCPYGPVQVSSWREKILEQLPDDLFTVHDSMHAVEHSLEALLPFLQARQRDLEIVPILIPYMSFEKMLEIAVPLSGAILETANKHNAVWGVDYSFLISTDCVHYGDEYWGGKNYAPYGTDTAGYNLAVGHELEIIDSCLICKIDPDKLRKFTSYTISEKDHKIYKWPWCGRYSVPFGLLTAYYLGKLHEFNIPCGLCICYATSIDHPVLSVADLRMGTTAPSNLHHWVGYVAIGYE